ncbi:MAG: thiamine diphosphokinase [Bacteroidales bacterium]|nr:thiamine diphosphokinase [Bacteroidales bacterium]MDT8432194.1 thiamine diphosphokinase [Bacteroidales bacterium]
MPTEKDHKVVILANGGFPVTSRCLEILDNAETIICCDEAAEHLLRYGREPDLIIGDMDSISRATRQRFSDRVIAIEEQETNDLTKAVNHCIQNEINEVTILGATGLREDHTLGNISLMLEYSRKITVRMVTDYGVFTVVQSGEKVHSFPGEKISFFSVDNRVKVTSEGLKYPLKNMQLHNWWRASLNEVTSDCFTLYYESEWPLLLFRQT